MRPLVACLNSAAVSYLCNCGNPMQLGAIYISGDTYGCG